MTTKFDWTKERIAAVRAMWFGTSTIVEIAAAVGTSRGVVQRLVDADRQTFPHRYKPHKSAGERKAPPVSKPAIKRTAHTDRVVRVTPMGSRVTLPRVTFIDGPAA